MMDASVRPDYKLLIFFCEDFQFIFTYRHPRMGSKVSLLPSKRPATLRRAWDQAEIERIAVH